MAVLVAFAVLCGGAAATAAPLTSGTAPTMRFGEGLGYLEIGTVRAAFGARWGGLRAGQWGVHLGLDHRRVRWELGLEATRPLAHGERTSAFASVVVEGTLRGRGPGVAVWPGIDLGVGVGPGRRLTLDVGTQGWFGAEVADQPLRAGVAARAGAAVHPSPRTSVTARGRIGVELLGDGRGWVWEAGGALVHRF